VGIYTVRAKNATVNYVLILKWQYRVRDYREQCWLSSHWSSVCMAILLYFASEAKF